MNMNQKYLAMAIGVVGLLVIGGGIFAVTRMSNAQPADQGKTTTKKRVADELNKIAVDQRPYLTLKPEVDGNNITLSLLELKKAASTGEYELEYQSGSLLQGAFGELKLEALPAMTKIFLGSCSAGGKCTFHEDIRGGSLLTRFEGAERYALKSDWRYFDNAAKASEFSSKDAKFQLISPDMKTQRYVIVFNAAGYPGTAPGSVVSEVFSLQTSNILTGKGTLVIRANEEGKLKIAGWDGQTWKTFDTKVDGKTATAEVTLMEAYVVIK